MKVAQFVVTPAQICNNFAKSIIWLTFFLQPFQIQHFHFKVTTPLKICPFLARSPLEIFFSSTPLLGQPTLIMQYFFSNISSPIHPFQLSLSTIPVTSWPLSAQICTYTYNKSTYTKRYLVEFQTYKTVKIIKGRCIHAIFKIATTM